jgi:hypothetical protein
MKTPTSYYLSLWRSFRGCTVALFLGGGLLQASAKTFTVKNLDDAGNGSLRSALQKLANSHDSSNTVTFKSGLHGIINLTTPLPEIGKSVSINGPGANKITVSVPNGGGFNVFTGVVSISGLTVEGRGTDASAAVRNQVAVLTIDECVLSGKNTANQIGLLNEAGGTTLITSSAIVNNKSNVNGGGVFNQGTLTVINSTIASNSASQGGAIYTEPGGTTALVNSTVADNIAAIQGGGLFNDNASISLGNTIVARNAAGATSIASDILGVVGSLGNNLIGSTAGGGGFVATDITNVPVADLGLAATIAVSQGPTPTLALIAGSPAINAGNNSLAVDGDGAALAFDQRGAPFARFVDGTVDIGAFESAIAAAPEDARAYKQRALMTISASLPSCDPVNAFYLRWAANRISASLESWLWIDGDHLSCYGFFVFLREQQAVWYLKKVTGSCASVAQSAIDDLVYADEKIAAATLNAASGAPGENYTKALNAYNQGVAAANNGNAFCAISWYSWSWWFATKALNKATSYDDDENDYHYCEPN